MKPTDIYDLPYHFFRDVLGYWLPGLILVVAVVGLAESDPRIQTMLNSPVIAKFTGTAIHTILLFALFAIASLAVGYTSLPAGHALVKVVASRYIEKAAACHELRILQGVRKRVGESTIASMQSANPKVLAGIKDEEVWALDKHVLYAHAQVEFADTYKTLVPRHYAMKLFHENLTFTCLIIGIMAVLTQHLAAAGSAAVFLGLNLYAAMYHYRKHETAIQCLLLVASVQRATASNAKHPLTAT